MLFLKILTAKLHIVSFEIPFPANYGGVIDVFYKLKALHTEGVEIYLHCFTADREKASTLEKYCKEVYYYQRKSLVMSLFSSLPVLVKSRSNVLLIKRLQETDAPILFEGLHTSYPLSQVNFNQKTFIRAHNIEHDYYRGLAASETSLWKKIFFQSEAKKLDRYEAICNKATGICTISPFEQDYFSKKFGTKAQYIPVFHEATNLRHTEPKGQTVAYHGDLRLSDNIKAANFIVDCYADSPYKLVIGGNSLPAKMQKRIDGLANVTFVNISDPKVLDNLFNEAQVHVLITYQKTGIKLKLLNSLHKGRYIIANSPMIEDTGLENNCQLANTKEEFLAATKRVMDLNFSEENRKERMEALSSFDPQNSAKKLVELIFK